MSYEKSVSRAAIKRLWRVFVCAIPVLLIIGSAVFYTTTAAPELTPKELLQNAIADLENGETEGMRKALAAFGNRKGYTSYVRLMDAVLFLKGGKPNEALKELAMIPSGGSMRRDVLFYSARALFDINRLVDAEDLLKRILSDDPADVEAHRWLGIIYYDLGAYDYAIATLKRVTELDVDDYRPHRLIALMYYDFERQTEAIPHYRAALTLNAPPSVQQEMRCEYAFCLTAIHKYEEALAVLSDAHDTAAVNSIRAKCEFSLGHGVEAESRLKAALDADPRERRALLLKIDILQQQDAIDTALAVAKEAVKHHPFDAECRFRLANILEERGDLEEGKAARAEWNRLKDLANRLIKLNVEALDEPGNRDVRLQIAEACEQLGKTKLAVRWRAAAEACKKRSKP